MDAASGLPPSHMFTQNAMPDDGIDRLVDGAEEGYGSLRSSIKQSRSRVVLCFCCSGLHAGLQLRIRICTGAG